jgi:methylated-DNA-[protein]-cysteine S-methyltransferase
VSAKRRSTTHDPGHAAIATLDAPLGQVTVAATPAGVSRVIIRPNRRGTAEPARRPVPPEARAHLRVAVRLLKRYFAGKPVVFEEPLDLSGATAFQQEVWAACARIPHGEVRSYAELARAAGRPRAARAVGGALGANPIPIIIPCHRVIRTDGSLGGFGLGLPVKRALLRLEGAL